MNYFGDDTRKLIFLVVGVSCFIVVLIATMAYRGAFAPEVIVPSAPLNTGETEILQPSATPFPETWAVYVTGEVNFPGVYEIEPGSRVIAAIEKAGGFSRDADQQAINLAARLNDEAHISVPSKNAILPPEDAHAETTSTRPRSGGITYPPGRDTPADGRPLEREKIDINRADAATLATLPGIGPALSQNIIAHRDENGPFPNIESLRAVRGIGARRFETIKDLIRAGD